MSRGRLLVSWGSSALFTFPSHLSSRPAQTHSHGKGKGTRASKLDFASTFQISACVTFANIPCAKANHTLANPSLSKRALQSCMARGVTEWRIKAINEINLSHFLFAFFCSHISTVSGGKEGRCAPKWTGSLPALSVHHVPLPMLFPETGMTFSLPSSINILTTFQSPDQMLSLYRSLL